MGKCEHGGDLDRAIAKFGGNRRDWLDLSTGINPNSYNVYNFTSHHWRDLPDQQLIDLVTHSAKFAYQAKFDCVPLAGVQQAIQLFPLIIKEKTKNAFIFYPSYNEYEAQLHKAGWKITHCQSLSQMFGADCAIVVNPNNPDGRQFLPKELLQLSKEVGTLIIDESFCDSYPHLSVLPHVNNHHKNVIVFRSLGKFYGLAGLRLGFVFSCYETLYLFSEATGKWAVSTPALSIGARALKDNNWRQQTLVKLEQDALCLDRIACQNGLTFLGGTNLFRLYRCNNAKTTQEKLAQCKIWTRIFNYSENWIRFGLPPKDSWIRLEKAMQS